MKKASTTAFFLCCALYTIAAQTIEIPDNNFLQALIEHGVDSNKDNLISQREAADVTDLDLNYKNIGNISGIEAFVNLTSLDCGDNSISSINLNNLTELEYLWCQNNSLSALDVSKCTKLKVLNFNTNFISTINLQNNPEIFWLDCSFTKINSLDLDALTRIETIACMYTGIRNLLVPDKPFLEAIIASNCQISTIDLSNDSSLKVLEINDNKIEELDLTSCMSIEYLAIRNMPELSRICAPYIPFQSASLTISASGSPNVVFSDCVPPTLSANNTEIYFGDTVVFESSEQGDFYLVADSIGSLPDSIIEFSRIHFTVEAETPFEIILTDTLDGTFCAYVFDHSSNASDPVCIDYMVDSADTATHDKGLAVIPGENIRFYPNPAQTCLYIETAEPILCHIDIKTTNGQVIFSQVTNSTNMVLDLNSIQSGLYFITIRSKEFIRTERIIKL